MGLRLRITLFVVASVLVVHLAWGITHIRQQTAALHAETNAQGLEVLGAIATPSASTLATREIEQLDSLLTHFAQDGDWGRLDLLDVALLDAEGRIVAHSSPERFGERPEDAFTLRARSSDEPRSEVVDFGTHRRLLLSRPIEAGLRWGTATASLSLDRVDQRALALRQQHIGTTAALALIVGALLFVLLSVFALRPVRELIEAVTRLSQGDYAARVRPTGTTPEFDLLARVFNEMAARIQANTEWLEDEVQARTRQLEVANTELERLAATDGLTGLANHRALQERLRQEVGRARRDGSPLSLLMVDVDHFKAFNDTHGHPQGDAVLAAIAQVLQGRLRSTDLAARYGGEEFAILLPNTGPTAARRVASKLVAAVRDLDLRGVHGERLGTVTISAGLATWSEPDESPSRLLARADSALYAAKKAGRDRVSTLGGVA